MHIVMLLITLIRPIYNFWPNYEIIIIAVKYIFFLPLIDFSILLLTSVFLFGYLLQMYTGVDGDVLSESGPVLSLPVSEWSCMRGSEHR